MSEMSIAENKVVTIHYVLKDDQGKVLDQSAGDEPLMYLHGHDGIVAGLEKALSGRNVGDKLEVAVEPADGYGERNPDAQRLIPRSAFPEDAPLAAGSTFFVEMPNGEAAPLWVLAVDDDSVSCDFNHPLAGMRLHFSVEIAAIRDATSEELDHGHVHGPAGHGHHH